MLRASRELRIELYVNETVLVTSNLKDLRSNRGSANSKGEHDHGSCIAAVKVSVHARNKKIVKIENIHSSALSVILQLAHIRIQRLHSRASHGHSDDDSYHKSREQLWRNLKSYDGHQDGKSGCNSWALQIRGSHAILFADGN